MSTTLKVIPQRDNKGMDCDICGRKFGEDMDSLVELTFHKIIKHGADVNEKEKFEGY